MNTELSIIEKVPFNGDTIEVARVGGVGYAHLKPLCKSLGVAFQPQLRKLQSIIWGGVTIMVWPDKRGRPQQLAMISLDAVPMWLATIHPSKVAFAVRIKLESYQLEAAMVLAAWFNGPTVDRIARMASLDRERTEEVTQIRAELSEARKHAGVAISIGNIAKGMVADAEERIDAILNPYRPSDAGPMTVRQARDEWQILGSDGRLLPDRSLPYFSLSCSAICRATRQPVVDVEDGKRGIVKAYPIGVLAAWKIDHDLRSRMTRESYAKFSQPRRFA